MIITIHRGTHQIGGCATEITSGETRIFIDFGSELPGKEDEQSQDPLSIPGVTEGEPHCDGVFFTHIHGDHIGQIHRILPEIPLYMGKVGKEISLVLNRRLVHVFSEYAATIDALERALTFTRASSLAIGNIRVTPFSIDHSVFDAYMFLIEADGVRLLHTGDFRGHGFIGKALIPMLEKYVGQVDWLVCEGTMLSRDGEKTMTERELQERAMDIMKEHKNVFVMCSSTNIDRIAAFTKLAEQLGRPLICDFYQKNVLDVVQENNSTKNSSLYSFKPYILYPENNSKLLTWMEERGFLMLVRASAYFRTILEQYRHDYKIVYSMWSGYLSGENKNQNYIDFLDGFEYEILHTSGHATVKTTKAVCDTVNPGKGIIPIHTEVPEKFKTLFPNRNVLLLDDGQEMEL